MENLGTLRSLQELWLGRNKIRQVALCGLTALRKLSVQSNRITQMSGLEVGGVGFYSGTGIVRNRT